MSKQPEALRLADMPSDYSSFTIVETKQAQAELRRLHALNAELLDACKQVDAYYSASLDHQPSYVRMARAAIAKAGAAS